MSTYKPTLFYCTGQNSFFLGGGGYLLILVCLRFKLNFYSDVICFRLNIFKTFKFYLRKFTKFTRTQSTLFLLRIPGQNTYPYTSVSFCRNPSRYILLSESQQGYPFVGTPVGISCCRNPSRDILLLEPQQRYPVIGIPAGIF